MTGTTRSRCSPLSSARRSGLNPVGGERAVRWTCRSPSLSGAEPSSPRVPHKRGTCGRGHLVVPIYQVVPLLWGRVGSYGPRLGVRCRSCFRVVSSLLHRFPAKSVFTLLYIFLLSSSKFTEAFIILPCLTSVERFEIQQSPFAPVRLCCPFHHRYYGLIRHPLVRQPTSSSDL